MKKKLTQNKLAEIVAKHFGLKGKYHYSIHSLRKNDQYGNQEATYFFEFEKINSLNKK